jgi:hypothetical protein
MNINNICIKERKYIYWINTFLSEKLPYLKIFMFHWWCWDILINIDQFGKYSFMLALCSECKTVESNRKETQKLNKQNSALYLLCKNLKTAYWKRITRMICKIFHFPVQHQPVLRNNASSWNHQHFGVNQFLIVTT